MGISLAEYAAETPLPDIPEDGGAAATKSIKEMAAAREEAAQLKARLLAYLQQGMEPQIIVEMAIRCIGLYTDDQEYIDAGTAIIGSVYGNLAQARLLRDDAEAREKLFMMQSKYNVKLRTDINRRLAGCEKIKKALTETLTALNTLEQSIQDAE